MKIKLLILTLFIVFLGCTDESPLAPVSESLVVRGYLYSGEPVNDIQITSTLALGSEDTIAPPINDAQVSLFKNGVSYNLIASDGDSGYYHYEGTDLTVETGDVFDINVDYGGNIASGTTTVPAPPSNVTVSANTVFVTTTFTPGEMHMEDSTRTIYINWDEDPSALFYVTIENKEENPDSIIIDFPFPPGGGIPFNGGGRFISAPTSLNEYQINSRSLPYYGKYEIKVYRVNQEYADLYSSRQQDSRDLNEPLTNINNGLGVFSAFNSTSIFITAVAD